MTESSDDYTQICSSKLEKLDKEKKEKIEAMEKDMKRILSNYAF